MRGAVPPPWLCRQGLTAMYLDDMASTGTMIGGDDLDGGGRGSVCSVIAKLARRYHVSEI